MMNLSPFLIFAASVNLSFAGEWPAWRGPEQDGSVGGEKPPAKFSNEENLLWKVALPGRGCSTPIVVNGKIILTSEIEGKDGVIAYDMNGKELWRKEFGEIRPGRGQRVGSSANSSPVTDGESVFVFFKSGTLASLDLSGKENWSFDAFERFGEDKLWWDVGTSPVIAGGNLVLAMMQTDAPSWVVALNRETGETVWEKDRPFDASPESGDAYTTPWVTEIDGRETVVCWGADHLTGQDSVTGEIVWTCGGFNPEMKKNWRVIASSVVSGNVALVPYARGEFVAGVRMGGTGDITDKAVLWKAKCGSDASTPVASDGKFYVLSDSGIKRGTVTCLDAESGEILWADKLPKGAQIYYSSPVLAGGTLICAREEGTVFTAQVSDDGLKNIQANEIGEGVIASPVVVDGKLLIRGDRSLFCFGK